MSRNYYITIMERNGYFYKWYKYTDYQIYCIYCRLLAKGKLSV